MAATSKFKMKCQSRSVSLPCRSHPSTLRIEEQLNKIKTASSKPSAETICCLPQLIELYTCMDDLLNSSITRVVSHQQNKPWVEKLIDESTKFLDVCGNTRDMVSQIKEHIRDLHCALRRKKGNSGKVDSIVKYNCFRKKMKKDARELVARLKQNDNIAGGGSMVVDSDLHQSTAVIKALIGVSEMTISVFEHLLLFFLMPVSKPKRWSLVVSKLIHRGMVACEHQQKQGVVNELESIYAQLREEGNMQTAPHKLERLEAQIQSMESGLEEMFRCLVHTRTSLLNIISH